MIIINRDRSVYMPERDRRIGFEGDHLAESRLFRIEDERLFACTFKLDLAASGDIAEPAVERRSEDELVLRWDVTVSAIGKGGVLPAQLRAFDPEGELVWHSAVMEFVASPSVAALTEEDKVNHLSEFDQIEKRTAAALDGLEEVRDDIESMRDETAQAAFEATSSAASVASSAAAAQADAARCAQAADTVGGHLADKSNPHEVTAAQVGAYAKSEADALLDEKLDKKAVVRAFEVTRYAKEPHLEDYYPGEIGFDFIVYVADGAAFFDKARACVGKKAYMRVGEHVEKAGKVLGVSMNTVTGDIRFYLDGCFLNDEEQNVNGDMPGPPECYEELPIYADTPSLQDILDAGDAYDASAHALFFPERPRTGVFDLELSAGGAKIVTKAYVDEAADDLAAAVKSAKDASATPYEGVDLAVRFSSEILRYSNEWAWIRARVTAGNYDGIHVGDYLRFTADGNAFTARIMGIDTYTGYGSVPVGHHIDWCCDELWPEAVPFNFQSYNNGSIPTETVTADGVKTAFTLTKPMDAVKTVKRGSTALTEWTYDCASQVLTFETAPAAGTLAVTGAGSQSPWLASNAYKYANSLAGAVPNGSDFNPDLVRVDYTAGGIYARLPQSLKNVIVEKRLIVADRYSASALANSSSAQEEALIGFIWTLTESELCGIRVWATGGYDVGGTAVQYPLFIGNMKRVKSVLSQPRRWWTLSARSGVSSSFAATDASGAIVTTTAALQNTYLPVCFRIAGAA